MPHMMVVSLDGLDRDQELSDPIVKSGSKFRQMMAMDFSTSDDCNKLAQTAHELLMISLDETDLRLLDLLQTDASLSNQDLAAAVNVSAATGLRRVRRLLESHVIERRVALLAPSVMGGLQALVELQLDRQGAEHLDAYEAIAVADVAVQQCWRVSPGPDFMLVLWVADMAAYNAAAARLFTQHANVRNVKTFFATKRAKFEPRIDVRAIVRATS
jgi:Lrp/AsnC family transcriptional regulator, leucine-responsive regulatory protein